MGQCLNLKSIPAVRQNLKCVQRSTAENQLQRGGREPDVTTRPRVIKLHGKVTEAVHRCVFHNLECEKKMAHLTPVVHFFTRLDCSGTFAHIPSHSDLMLKMLLIEVNEMSSAYNHTTKVQKST